MIEKCIEYNKPLILISVDYKENKIQRGVRQGDTIYSKLFTAVIKYFYERIIWDITGVTINGEDLSHLKFAYNISLISDSVDKAANMLEKLFTRF